jgi:hypothetical protein
MSSEIYGPFFGDKAEQVQLTGQRTLIITKRGCGAQGRVLGRFKGKHGRERSSMEQSHVEHNARIPNRRRYFTVRPVPT